VGEAFQHAGQRGFAPVSRRSSRNQFCRIRYRDCRAAATGAARFNDRNSDDEPSIGIAHSGKDPATYAEVRVVDGGILPGTRQCQSELPKAGSSHKKNASSARVQVNRPVAHNREAEYVKRRRGGAMS
jgi:hypothetical protein